MADMTRRDLGAAALAAAAAGGIGPGGAAGGGVDGGLGRAEAMAGDDDPTALQVPAQSIPVPRSISPAAQAFLAAAGKRIAATRAARAAGAPPAPVGDGAAMAAILDRLRPGAARFKGQAETIDLGNGARLYHFRPDGLAGRAAQVAYFEIHGGGFTSGGGEMCRLLAQARAADYGIQVYAVDYRLVPAHAYPAPLDDCMAAYRAILKAHKAPDLVVGGSSAGGNLAAAMLLRGRDEELHLPAGLLLLTPGLDLLNEGDSHRTNKYLDVNLYGEGGAIIYGAGQDRRHPYLSPLFGDFAKGWPPTILATGTRDLLLSDTVRMHRALRRAGIRADLLVTEAGAHGGFQGQAPEDMEVLAECRKFIFLTLGIA